MSKRFTPLKKRSLKSYFIQELEKEVDLSPREIDCIKELLRQKTVAECAQSLNVATQTIEFYINNLKAKLSCQSHEELMGRIKNIPL